MPERTSAGDRVDTAMDTVESPNTTLEAREKDVVKQEHDQLVAIERYYHRAASRAGRLVYITGMLMGLVPVFLLVVLLGFLLWVTGLWDRRRSFWSSARVRALSARSSVPFHGSGSPRHSSMLTLSLGGR